MLLECSLLEEGVQIEGSFKKYGADLSRSIEQRGNEGKEHARASTTDSLGFEDR